MHLLDVRVGASGKGFIRAALASSLNLKSSSNGCEHQHPYSLVRNAHERQALNNNCNPLKSNLTTTPMALQTSSRRSIAFASHPSLYEFLAPGLLKAPRASQQIRCLSSSPRRCSVAASNKEQSNKPVRALKSAQEAASNPAPLNKPLTQAQRDFLTSAVSPHPSPHGNAMF